MFCTTCGAQLTSTSAFCNACGTPTGLGVDRTTALRRPGLITLLAVLQFISAAICLVGGGIAFIASVFSDAPDAALGVGLGLFFVVWGALALVCGNGLWQLKPYGRTIQLGFAGIGLLAIPIGTVISALIIYYLLKPGIRILFSGRPASDLTPAELVEVSQAAQGSYVATAIVLFFVALGGVALIGIIAAIAVPGLLRARMSGNESVAIGSMRSIASAQAAYSASAGGGHYAIKLSTLAVPCPGTSQGFITPDLSQDPSMKSGYRVGLESAGVDPGPPDCNGVETERDFYATASPQQAGTTGQRAFSTSATGTIFVDPSGVPPSIAATLSGTATELR